MLKKIPDNYRALIALIGYMMLVRLYVGFFPASFRSIQQMQALDWPFIGIWSALGFLGLYFYRQAGFPSFNDSSNTQRWVYPALAGILLGFLSVINDQVSHWTEFVEGKMDIPSIHIPFPQSILIYPAGAIVHEIFNRIFLLSLLMWILQKATRKEKNNSTLFWISAVITSLVEPYGDVGLWSFSAWAAVTSFTLDFVINLTQAWFMRQSGFMASVTCRVALYAVWHVGYGYFIP